MTIHLNTIGILAVITAPAASALLAATLTARMAGRYTDHELDRRITTIDKRVASEAIGRATNELLAWDRMGRLDTELATIVNRPIDTRSDPDRPPVRWHDSAGNTVELAADRPRRPAPIIKPDPDLLTTDTHGNEPPYTPDPVEGHTRNIIKAIAHRDTMRPDRHG